MANQETATIRDVVKDNWFYAFAIVALIFATGCPAPTPPAGGGAAPPAPAATITIGAAGSCPGGSVTITGGPTWTAVPGGQQLSMTVCVKCPDATGTMVGVTGATVTGVVEDATFGFPASMTSTSGTTGAGGCVTLTKRVANATKALMSGKTFVVNFQDATGNPLLSTTVTIP